MTILTFKTYTEAQPEICFGGGQNRGTGDNFPSGVQGQSPGGGPPEAEDIYANNHCNNVLSKNP